MVMGGDQEWREPLVLRAYNLRGAQKHWWEEVGEERERRGERITRTRGGETDVKRHVV